MVARAENTRRTVERVLDVAVTLFTDHPYDEVSLEQIAQRAGVTKRTVLRRFDSKESLFVAAMERARDEMVLQRQTAPVGDVPGAVRNLLDHYERWGRNRLRLLSQEDRIPVVADHVRGGRDYHRSWVEHTFAPLVADLSGAARKRRVVALVALTDVYTWKLLRHDLDLARAEVERTLVESIAMLAETG